MTPIQVVMQTHLTQQELDKMGFSMSPDSKNGWIYEFRSGSNLIETVNRDGTIDAKIEDLRDDELIDAIVSIFEDRDADEKLSFIAQLSRELSC